MNMPSLTLGAAAMNDREYFEKTTAKVVATRERVKVQLKELGFEFGDSATNFIFARHPQKAGKEIFDYLRAHDIIVRRFDLPRISEYLRISIGTDEDMDTLISVLKEIV
jgi:histidinol-phosphate aminotransferase